MAKLEKKHINPVIAKWSYSRIIRECGSQGEEIAKVLGIKKPSKPKFNKED